MRTIVTKPEPYCPLCGARMILRRPPEGKTWQPFWGCNDFPTCRGTRNIDPETGKPESDDDIIEDDFRSTIHREVNKIKYYGNDD